MALRCFETESSIERGGNEISIRMSAYVRYWEEPGGSDPNTGVTERLGCSEREEDIQFEIQDPEGTWIQVLPSFFTTEELETLETHFDELSSEAPANLTYKDEE